MPKCMSLQRSRGSKCCDRAHAVSVRTRLSRPTSVRFCTMYTSCSTNHRISDYVIDLCSDSAPVSGHHRPHHPRLPATWRRPRRRPRELWRGQRTTARRVAFSVPRGDGTRRRHRQCHSMRYWSRVVRHLRDWPRTSRCRHCRRWRHDDRSECTQRCLFLFLE